MNQNILRRIFTSFFLIIILLIGLFYNELTWKIFIILFSCLCFYEFYKLIIRINKNKILNTIIILLVLSYLYFFYSLLIRIRYEFGEETILILLLSCVFSDIGGYIVGKTFKGPKLTKISPNKTISGAIGSIIFTVIGTSFLILFLKKIGNDLVLFEFSVFIYLGLVLMSVFCQFGDLFVSYLKRKAKIKDTGKILPGHGGVLDRVDGIIFAIPFGYLLYSFLVFNS